MSDDRLREVTAKYGTPLYVYDRQWLSERAKQLLNICRESNILARYAVKANPNPEIISMFGELDLELDASSEYEAEELIAAGIEPARISLSSQQPPRDMATILQSGVKFVATSLHQLELVQASNWQGELGVRVNPGIGSGHNNRTTTGGVSASFGIWHEYLDKVKAWQKQSGCNINRLHIHIGSGGDVESWRAVIDAGLQIAKELPSVASLDMGGGFKVARLEGEKAPEIEAIISAYAKAVDDFNNHTGRALRLEIEPGTWLVANGGYLVSKIIDIVDTGSQGYTFLKLDTGMNDLLRPALYGAQHPIKVLNDSAVKKEYVVVGHNCESGDLLTPAPGDPEKLAPRLLNEARIGDLIAIGGAGAYGASMRAVGYNSFPSAKEVLV